MPMEFSTVARRWSRLVVMPRTQRSASVRHPAWPPVSNLERDGVPPSGARNRRRGGRRMLWSVAEA